MVAITLVLSPSLASPTPRTPRRLFLLL
uniref:Uncharacterized protein n=1 Tax=Timema genevievae TaxID=629358 RepID=A0A7R9KC44_TIMGE|nr:unnamed protein product [Timema genevievae]